MPTAKLIIQFIIGLAISLPLPANDRSSTIAVSPDGQVLAVVNNDARSLTLVEIASSEIIKEIFVGRAPQAVAFDSAGEKIYVTNRLDDTVSVIDLENLSVIDTIAVPDEPIAVVVSPDGTVFVSCMGANIVAVIDSSTESITELIETETDPRGLALSADASKLYVIHFTTGRFSVINTASLEVENTISTGADTNLSNSIRLNADGTLAYLPQTRSNVSNPALLFDTTLFPVVSVIDLESLTPINTSRIHLDISDVPVNMPFDTALVGEHTLYVLNAGSNDISIIDLESANSLAHLELGNNPRGMVLSADQGTLYINNNLSGTILVIDTSTNEITSEIQVTQIPLLPTILNGKRLFNSSDTPDLARDQWISCAACHFEGETDKRTWFFPDGIRNTPSLLGIADTLPIHWSGDLDELQDVEITVRNIQAGTGLAPGGDNCTPACDQAEPNAGRSQALDDLAAYMATLQLSPNPNLEENGSMSEAATRGKGLFEAEETLCSSCHIPPIYSDFQKHDVGTGEDPGERKGKSFDTPSLRGIYKTGAYLHHGTAETLLDVLTTQNRGDLHGKTSHLTESELADLVAFLGSVGSGSVFQINAGLNDAWVNANAPFQGLFVTVFPVLKLIFVAWFTFDSERPPDDVNAVFGAPDQRWVTALGSYNGSSAILKAELTTGGGFNASVPLPSQDTNYGTIDLEFTNCRTGIVKFDFPTTGQSGEFAIQRVLESNVGICETLAN